jgi:RNA polymerase sigma-70 factor (ECF subfamily)
MPETPPATNGRPTAEQVFHQYAPRVYTLARRMLGNDADAEDVTQDVLLQVVRKLNTFRGDADLFTWLHRVTVNAALAHRARKARRQEHEVHDPLNHFLDDGNHAHSVRPWSVAPDQQALDREREQIIERAIAGLPEIYRDVYVLSDVEGLSNPQIGEMLNLSLPAVKSRLHRGRLLMRDALAPHFEEATL